MKKIVAALLVTLAMTGTALADSKYNVSVDAPKTAKASTRTTAKVKVAPAGGYKMNLEYPTKLKLTAPEGVTLEKATLAKADGRVDTKSAEFDVAFTAETRGKKTFTGEFKFAVCTENDCIPQTEKVSFDVEVQ
jgi:hypothetical protein